MPASGQDPTSHQSPAQNDPEASHQSPTQNDPEAEEFEKVLKKRWMMPDGESSIEQEHRKWKMLSNCGDYLSLELQYFRDLLSNKKPVNAEAKIVSGVRKLITGKDRKSVV